MIPNLPNSHWPNTLGTHGLPTPRETDDIRRAIENADTGIALIDKDIIRLNEVLAYAKLRRAEISSHEEAHKALLAPLRRCPDEILSEIFIYWFHQKDDKHHKKIMPWYTGTICRRWREVALRTSALWSDIIFVHNNGERGSGVRRGEMLRELFRRTGVSRPVSLQITSYSAPLSEFTEDILPAILPTSNRWRHLRLRLTTDKIKSLSPVKGALSSLESLVIQGDMPAGEACEIFEVAPRLFRVYMDVMDLSVGDITLPWTQMTDFSVGMVCSWERCLTLLSDCPNLVSCAFDGVVDGVAETSQFRNSVLHHAHLRNLKPKPCFLTDFFDCLSTPKLRTFHITTRCLHPVMHIAITNFLLRSHCTIVTFKWDGFIHGLSHVIRFMSELEELQLLVTRAKEAQLACKLLLELTLDASADENSCLCPRLHTIHLYSAGEFDKHVLLVFIKSRWPMRVSNQHVKPLRSVRLIMGIKFEESDKVFSEELEVLRDEGIDIVIDLFQQYLVSGSR